MRFESVRLTKSRHACPIDVPHELSPTQDLADEAFYRSEPDSVCWVFRTLERMLANLQRMKEAELK